MYNISEKEVNKMENKEIVLKQFEVVLDMVKSILDLIHDNETPYKYKRPVIVEKTKQLKEHLKSEYRRLQKLDNKDQLSHYESAFYYPAVYQSFANFSAPYNTRDMTKLSFSLFEVRDEFELYYTDLKNS